MRATIYDSIITLLNTCSKFQGEDGTTRVYDWATSAPSGYPWVVVGSESLEGAVLDNTRDARLYNFVIQIVGEKFGEQGAMSQSNALKAMRDAEDAVLALLDGHNTLGVSFVIRTMPTHSHYGFTDNNGRVVLTIKVKVDTTVQITM